MKNTVIAGDYKDGFVQMDIKITKDNVIYIVETKGCLIGLIMLPLRILTLGLIGKNRKVLINKETVESYELIDEENQTSATSAVARGALGSVLLGPVGIAVRCQQEKRGFIP